MLPPEKIVTGSRLGNTADAGLGDHASDRLTVGVLQFTADQIGHPLGQIHGLIFQGFTDAAEPAVNRGANTNLGKRTVPDCGSVMCSHCFHPSKKTKRRTVRNREPAPATHSRPARDQPAAVAEADEFRDPRKTANPKIAITTKQISGRKNETRTDSRVWPAMTMLSPSINAP